MRFYIIVGVIFVLSTIALLMAFGSTIQTLVNILIVVIALLPIVVRKSPRLYLWIAKIRFAVLNTPATWDLNVRFREIRDTTSPLSLARSLIQWAGDGSNIISQSEDRVVIRLMRRFVIELYHPSIREGLLPENLEENEVVISILPINVGYRDSRHFLNRELLPLLEESCRKLGAGWASYAMQITLPERNPFYGLYLQQFNLEMVRDFKIEFLVPSRTKQSRVVVAKEHLTVVSDSIEGFRSAVSAALAFRIPEMLSCQ